MANPERWYTDYNGNVIDIPDSATYGGGYTRPYCHLWVDYSQYHNCLGGITWHYSQYNKTEQAFNILKALVKEGVVKEPGSFKKFCELIEKIAKVV